MTSEITWEDRFWAKVDVRGEDECWVWTASVAGGGYGQFGLRHGKTVPAHRLSWEMANGTIPDGLWILHRCDNKPCVNPNHLFLGTRQDNVDDMMAKGRHWIRPCKGEQNGRAKLTDAQVKEIRARWATGVESQSAIARDYPMISRIKVSEICRGKAWAHVE